MLFSRNHPLSKVKLVQFNNYGLNAILSTKLSGFRMNIGNKNSVECPDDMWKLPYRLADGSCNHLRGRSEWGASITPMFRLLPPAFEDGLWQMRKFSRNGFKLPSPRKVSENLFPAINRPHSKYNLLVMQFGQFLAHDFLHSSSITYRKSKKNLKVLDLTLFCVNFQKTILQ